MPAKIKPEDIAEALLDSKVLEAVAKALHPLLTGTIESAIAKKLDVFNAALSTLKSETLRLTEQCGKLSKENAELRKQLDFGNGRIDDLERYSRCDNLIIRGLPETSIAETASPAPSLRDNAALRDSHTSVEKTVLSFLKDSLHLDVLPSDISTAHRIRSSAKDSVRPIIVRFSHRRVCNLVYSARAQLKSAKSNVFISDHLIKSDSDLFFEACKLLREKKIFAAWTQHGLVHVRFSPDPSTKPTIVRTRADLALRP